MSGDVKLSRDGDVASILISHPRKLNAMTVAMWRSLREIAIRLGRDEELRCIVIAGDGDKAFSAGADISEFAATRATRDQVTAFHEAYVGACLAALQQCDVPTVAKIRGICMGGGLEIASVCDIRLADDTARFGAPVGKLGFPLAFGETQALYGLVGPAVAAELLIEGRVFTAADAQQRGLVTRVAASADLDREVGRAVDGICQSGRLAARSHKRQLRRLRTDPSPVTLAERTEVYGFADTAEYHEGYRRFLARSS